VGLPFGVAIARVAVHSPDCMGNFCCAGKTAAVMHTIALNGAHLKNVIFTCRQVLNPMLNLARSSACLSTAKCRPLGWDR
jgi:hypothetical protein